MARDFICPLDLPLKERKKGYYLEKTIDYETVPYMRKFILETCYSFIRQKGHGLETWPECDIKNTLGNCAGCKACYDAKYKVGR